MDKQFHIFISYSSLDKKIADRVCSDLEAKSLRCWIAPRNINAKVGIEYSEAIIDGIAASQVMVVLLTKNSNDSTAVLKEVERAVHYRLAILPVRFDDTPLSKGLEFFLSSTHWLDARDKKYSAWFNELYQNCVSIPGVQAGADETLLPGKPTPPKVPPPSKPWEAIITLAVILAIIGITILVANSNAHKENKKIIQSITHWDEKKSNFEFIPCITLLSDTSGTRRIVGRSIYIDTLAIKSTYREIWINYDARWLFFYHRKYLEMRYADKLKYSNLNNFFISRYEINARQWKAVMGAEAPGKIRKCYECPLEIPEEQIKPFVEKLNKKTGRQFRLATNEEIAYATDLGVFNKDHYDIPESYNKLEVGKLGFRLSSDTRVLEDLPADRVFNNQHPIKVGLHIDTLKLKADTSKYIYLGMH